MSIRTLLPAAAFVTAATLGSATAAEIGPLQAGSVDLGTVSGIAYYTAEPKGYRVVVTLAPRAAAPAVRFETVLAAEQSVTLSTPRQPGAEPETVEIRRDGDRVLVTRSRVGSATREAAALE